jgi:hypothetical protein
MPCSPAILTLLALTGRLAPIWVFVVATLVGLVRPNDQALRNILIGETMPAPRLMGALSFSRATMDSARVAGALAGAGLFTVLGIGPAYILVTALYVASGGLTFGVARRRLVPDLGASPRAAVRGAATAVGVSGLRDLKEGLLHVWRTPALHGPMWLAFLINLTAYPISGGLLPYVARQVYGVDATGPGLSGGQLLARRPHRLRRHGRDGRPTPARALHARLHDPLVRGACWASDSWGRSARASPRSSSPAWSRAWP